nr:hypothetical protein OG781_02635 [Streptomyces sp. NBC_00830]
MTAEGRFVPASPVSSQHAPDWGHGGDILGYETAGGATVDGRQATVMVNVDPGGSDAQDDDMKAAVQTALCEGRPSASQSRAPPPHHPRAARLHGPAASSAGS